MDDDALELVGHIVLREILESLLRHVFGHIELQRVLKSVIYFLPLPRLIIKLEPIQAECQDWRQLGNFNALTRLRLLPIAHRTFACELIVSVKFLKGKELIQ